MKSNTPTFTVTEVDDAKEDSPDATASSGSSHFSRPPATNPSSLALYDDSLAQHQQNLFQQTLHQQTKTTDDSKTAYGEKYASSFGQRGIAPMPEPSAPILEDNDWKDYQAWTHAATYADRASFPNHVRWSAILDQHQTNFTIDLQQLSKDTISEQFKLAVSQGQFPSLLAGSGLPQEFQDMDLFRPVDFGAQRLQDNEHAAGYFDQVTEMMNYADELHKTSYLKGKFLGQEIPNDRFYVLSDHNGGNSGTHLQIWGPGVKKSFSSASASSHQALDKVEGTNSFPITTSYAHVPNRFTIIRINDNEMGFVLERVTNKISQLISGRYVIPEKEFAYVGKTQLVPGSANKVLYHEAQKKDDYIKQIAESLTVVQPQAGKVIFMSNNSNTYQLPFRAKPYIFDQRRGEKFLNFANNNQQTLAAADNSYIKINRLQPGQFIIFQHDGNSIVWQYDAENPHFNTLHLTANQFNFDGVIHNINESHVAGPHIDVVNVKPGQLMVVSDDASQIKFVEDAKPKTYVLRMPWKFVEVVSQNQVDYRAGNQEDGNEVARLMLRSSEWVAVLDRSGSFAIYPPRLDRQPYYFRQPEHTVVGVINRHTIGETPLNVPGIGQVSIVNIQSGSIGACRIRNIHFFLNPSAVPYVFVPPDAFIKIIDAIEAHVQVGDLHRIVLKPEERAIVSKDGKLYRLPAENIEDNKALSEENGVYVFRSFQLQVYGPMNKSNRKYDLGPIQYFNVGVGEVAYGTLNGKLKIWGPGEHSVDNRKNEWFTDFFSTNVDPVEIDNLAVTFQHGITGSVGVYVSYHIVDSEKAIQQFKDHQTLHQFIMKTTQSN